MTLSFVLTATALTYLVIKRRVMQSWPDFLALLIMIGFGIVVLAATNRQIRYASPVIVGLPFLVAILVSGKGHSASGRSAALTAGLVFCGLLAAGVPTGHRVKRQSLSRAEAVLAQAARCNAKHILLATDSPTLNNALMLIAMEFSPSGVLTSDTLALEAAAGVPIEHDFLVMSESDQVVFQDRYAIDLRSFTNQRVLKYKEYVQWQGFVPTRVGDDVKVYSLFCRP